MTVIATGFPEPDSGHNGSSTIVRTPLQHKPRTEEEFAPADDGRGRIFNSLGIPRKRDESEDEQRHDIEKIPTQQVPIRSEIKTEAKPVDPIDEDDDGDWGAVPAFLRRSKLK